jgi:hypothetical protein
MKPEKNKNNTEVKHISKFPSSPNILTNPANQHQNQKNP